MKIKIFSIYILINTIGAQENQTKIDLRDPFKKESVKVTKENKRVEGFYKDGAYTNLPDLNGVPIQKIKIVGILLGKERRAIAKIDGSSGNDSYMLKEGMKLGENKAEIKAILPGGIVLVEKIKNIYDQDEFIETIIPVSE